MVSNIKLAEGLLRKLRIEEGFSEDEVAKKLGISVEEFRELEEGRRNISFKQIETLARLYQRPTALFFRTDIEFKYEYKCFSDEDIVQLFDDYDLEYDCEHEEVLMLNDYIYNLVKKFMKKPDTNYRRILRLIEDKFYKMIEKDTNFDDKEQLIRGMHMLWADWIQPMIYHSFCKLKSKHID